jgi:hypothetical protein
MKFEYERERLTYLPDFPTPIALNGIFKIGARVYFKDGFADDDYTSGIICSNPKPTDNNSYSYEVMIDLQKKENFEPDDYIKVCIDERYMSLN